MGKHTGWVSSTHWTIGNFIAIQQEHAIACDGYHQATVRTGYDNVVAHRSHDLFAYTAKKPGVVKSIQPKGIIIENEDGTLLGVELGRRFGNASGLTVPHNIITPLKAGERFEVGGVICYNDGFFEPDFFNPKEIVWKNAMNVTTVLWEGTQTYEDASSISKRVEERLTTRVTKLKTVVVAFDQALSRLVKVGERVEADTILCIIEDAVTADNKLFDEKSLDTLRSVESQTPRAHVKGIIERIEVFYHGDKDYMSESLRAIADDADRTLRRNALALGQPSFTGAVDGGFRIDNNQLVPDTMAIRIYITSSVNSGVGDKGVFCNQMKTVFSEVLESEMVTETGQKIDAVFGQKSIDARIVSSPPIIGTSNVLLKLIAKQAVALYRGKPA